MFYEQRTDSTKTCRDVYSLKGGFDNKISFKLPMDVISSVNFALLLGVKFMEISVV